MKTLGGFSKPIRALSQRIHIYAHFSPFSQNIFGQEMHEMCRSVHKDHVSVLHPVSQSQLPVGKGVGIENIFFTDLHISCNFYQKDFWCLNTLPSVPLLGLGIRSMILMCRYGYFIQLLAGKGFGTSCLSPSSPI